MARRKGKPQRRPSTRAGRSRTTTTKPSPSQGGFRLPPGVSSSKEPLSDGMAYVFRHEELALLGRLILQDMA